MLDVSGEVCGGQRGGCPVAQLPRAQSAWGFGVWHRGSRLCLCRCGRLQWEKVEWCWEESWGGAPAAALAAGQFCILPGDPPGFVCWCWFHSAALDSSVCPIQQGWGFWQAGGTPSYSWGCIYRAQRERKGFGSLRYKREQGAPRPSCLQWCLCCFITLSWC